MSSFFGLSLPKRLNCWLIFVSQLDSLPLTLHLLPLILTRLLTPKSEDPSSLASGNELVRWAVRFIAHEAGVSLCECVSVYRDGVWVCVGGGIFFFLFIACLHFSEHQQCMCTPMWGSTVLNLYQHVFLCLHVYMNITHLWQCHKLCHTSWTYHLPWQVYVLFNFPRTWSCVADWVAVYPIPKSRIDHVEEGRFWEFLLVFLCILPTDLPCLPVCGVIHSPVLHCSLLWHIDWFHLKALFSHRYLLQ